MRHGPQLIRHPGPLGIALMFSVLLAITLVAAAFHGDIDNPTMLSNLLEIGTGVSWAVWGIACLTSSLRPKQTAPAPPDASELEELLEQWRY